MTDGAPFIDYYDILQVDPDCNPRVLESAYRYLAKLFHPDHRDTADVEKFNRVIEAYRALKDPGERAEYDLLHAASVGGPETVYFSQQESEVDERAALTDGEVHEKTLRLLYTRRREDARNAGVAPYFVQEMLGCSDAHFDFYVWYLKAKGLIETTEQGTLAITIQGVDHVISTSRTTKAENLRIAQSSEPRD